MTRARETWLGNVLKTVKRLTKLAERRFYRCIFCGQPLNQRLAEVGRRLLRGQLGYCLRPTFGTEVGRTFTGGRNAFRPTWTAFLAFFYNAEKNSARALSDGMTL
jgi:hypothetical protein